MFLPGMHSEHDVLVHYIDAQLTALRTSAHGLTDAQARETPCRSTLSIGGLVKHATWVLQQREHRKVDATSLPGPEDMRRFVGSFALTDDETLEGVLQEFDAARATYLADIRAVDPGAPTVERPAPWDGVYEPTGSVERYALAHHIEEFARHAGHADIIREQLDGANAASLLMAVEGRPGNDYVQPWRPSSGEG